MNGPVSLAVAFVGTVDGQVVAVPNAGTKPVSSSTVLVTSARLRRDGARVVLTLKGTDVAKYRHITIWRKAGKKAIVDGKTFMTPKKTWTWAMYTAAPQAGAVKTVTFRVGDGHQKTVWMTVTMNRNRVISMTS